MKAKKIITITKKIATGAYRRFTKLPVKKRVFVVLVAVSLMGGFVGYLNYSAAKAATEAAGTKTLPAPVGPQKGTPTYGTLLPESKDISALGGWTRVSPPDRNAVYAYVDTIGPTKIIVSEQELPKEFKEDPEGQTSGLATSYNATRKLVVGSTTVYLGTSTEGPQSAIFQKDGLLVLIKAGAAIDDAQWKDYVNSLQ